MRKGISKAEVISYTLEFAGTVCLLVGKSGLMALFYLIAIVLLVTQMHIDKHTKKALADETGLKTNN